ncbi:LamG-like jellyroll fold domain-containing protein [Thalassoglobus sp.]|uniref:LamG-like jellyroll fold domain-containing protein n=1 Tax=Thalassoglobus sp. TaxID=2795869 RepID=UPI003AA9BEE5
MAHFRLATSRLASASKLFLLTTLLCGGLTARVDAQTDAVQWWKEYTGSEANGPAVLGYWKFDGGQAGFLKDSSSHDHQATLRGAKLNASGRFGGCLESSAGYPIADESHSIHVAKSPVLSPRGAFTIEMWIRGKDAEAFPPEVRPVLMDMKYVSGNHTGFLFSMTNESGDGTRQFSMAIGLGESSQTWYSHPFRLKKDAWQHVALTYDAAGTLAFYLDGSELSRSTVEGAGAMAPATRQLSIGDRSGSLYNGFPGFIDGVRMTQGVREFRPIRFESTTGRFVAVRMSPQAKVSGELINQMGQPLTSGSVTATLPGGDAQKLQLKEVPKSGTQTIEFPVDSSLHPGEYEVELVVDLPKWGDAGEGFQSKMKFPFVITPRPLPERMPVVMWGVGGTDNVIEQIPTLKELGFTHCIGLRVDYQRVWDEGDKATAMSPDQILNGRKMLNAALENDVQIVASLSPGSWLRKASVGKPFLRIDRNGKHYDREDVSGVFPQIQDFCFNTGAAVGKAYGDHPAFDAALLHTEVRGESQVSFHPQEIAAYREATGAEIPAEVVIKNGVQYQKLKDFPKDRVIADDHPILKFYQWFWQKGDNWNDLNTRLHNGLKQNVSNKDFWTFYDPAVRVPSISGSGGEADILSHWTYSYPDPIRIGLCADELFEMARANGHEQDVMKMTQLIWYRSQTAPIQKNATGETSPWVDQDPDAAYITIAPMHLREAFWWKMARPIKGIMYHGWQSLVEMESPGAYRYTNPNTKYELKRLVNEVVVPLGPTFKQIPDANADVVFLESFTSQMFARRGTYGWNRGWAGDMYHVLMYAQLQPRVMYEESLLKGGLDGAKVLVLADCDVLTDSAVKAIQKFQASGGLVIGDAEVCPAIQRDYTITRFGRTNKADVDRAKIQEVATDLHKWLEGKYSFAVESTNHDVVTRRRTAGTTDYIFAVNDRREFGSYVGPFGMVMENGLPSKTDLLLNRKQGYLYDLVNGVEVTAMKRDQGLSLPVSLGPCEGRVYMVTERPIRDVKVAVAESAKRGSKVTLKIGVTDGETPVDAVVPLHVRIVNPEGIEAEFTGYYGAANGMCSIEIDLASNDQIGVWEIQAKELASGKSSAGYLRVTE